MAFSLVVFCAVVVAANAAAIQYPPGVSPAACFNYPFCNVLIDPSTGHARADAANYPNYIQVNPIIPAGVAPGAQLPAGVHPALCTDWPICSDSKLRAQEFVKTGIAHVPAGVNAAAYYG